MNSRILLVEDEPGLVVALSDLLRQEGYDVETATDGPTGLARATSEPFDLVLLDVMLPGKNGFEPKNGSYVVASASRPGLPRTLPPRN